MTARKPPSIEDGPKNDHQHVTPRPVGFRRLVEQAPVICWVSSSDLKHTRYIATSVENLIGFPQSHWLEQPGFFAQRLHDEDRDWVVKALRKHARTAAELDIEFRMISKDGSPIWVRFVATATPYQQAGRDLIHGVLLDVTEQKRTEEQLKIRDAIQHRLIEASTRINAERTLRGVLREVADSAREVIGCRYAALGILDSSHLKLSNFVVSGLDEDEIERIGALPTGKGILGLVMKRRDPIRLANLSEHAESYGFPAGHPPMNSFLGVPVVGVDGPYGNLYFTEKEGGGEFTEDDEAVAVMFAANAAVAVRNARLDEEGVQLLSDLQQLQRTRDRFYAMINHELRNALTAVHGWSELMLRKAGHDAPRPVLETVESAEYALQLLNDLLDLSRLDAEMLEVRLDETDALQIAQSSADQMEPVASAGGVEVVVSCESATNTMCTTDERRVRQVILNLLSNAIRHSPYGATVDLEVRIDEQRLAFRVIDKGDGIGPEEMAIIFDAYVRAETRAGGGTGLGLTLSRRLARILGGDLTVSSQPGRGAQFVLELPRRLSGRQS